MPANAGSIWASPRESPHCLWPIRSSTFPFPQRGRSMHGPCYPDGASATGLSDYERLTGDDDIATCRSKRHVCARRSALSIKTRRRIGPVGATYPIPMFENLPDDRSALDRIDRPSVHPYYGFAPEDCLGATFKVSELSIEFARRWRRMHPDTQSVVMVPGPFPTEPATVEARVRRR